MTGSISITEASATGELKADDHRISALNPRSRSFLDDCDHAILHDQ
jgi:hypothetical protein